jgi:hypothetical protein
MTATAVFFFVMNVLVVLSARRSVVSKMSKGAYFIAHSYSFLSVDAAEQPHRRRSRRFR